MFIIRFPFYLSEFHFSDADRTGARVAETYLMEAALVAHAVDGIYVINDDLSEEQKFRELKLSSSVVIEAHSSWIKERIESGGDFIALVPIVYFSKMALWRQNVRYPIPICAIVHAIPQEDLVPAYIASICLARTCDLVAVSSNAGATTVRLFLQQCEQILDNSSGSRSLLSDQIRVLPLPVPPLGQSPMLQSEARRILEMPPDAVIFLSLGRITSRYKADLEPMIRAFAAANSPGTKYLVIAGHEAEEHYLDRLKEFIGAAGLDSSVKFILNIPSYAKHLMYAAADVFVAPSDNLQETYGLAVVEAMMAKLPVVATNWSGFRDIVVDGDTGILVDTWLDVDDESALSMIAAKAQGLVFESTMSQRALFNVGGMIAAFDLLLTDEALRVAMGGAGQKRAFSHFCSDTLIPKYRQMWEEQIQEANNFPVIDGPAVSFLSPFISFPYSPDDLLNMRIAPSLSNLSSGLMNASDHSELLSEIAHKKVGDLFMEGSEMRALVRNLLKKGVLLLDPPVKREQATSVSREL